MLLQVCSLPVLVFVGLALVCIDSGGAAESNEIRFTVKDRVIGHVDGRLFGEFMERATWGEPGPEAARIPGTRRLQPSVIERLREMRLPVIRFPGGTDVDYIDWRDLVDNVPGRGKERPAFTVGHSGRRITNNFGYDEFLRLCQDLGAEPLLVLNFRDALLRVKPLDEAAGHAAGLVAYCNAPQGAARPPGMPDWPAVRASNGRAEPYRVRYFQIGNETWAFWEALKELGMSDEEAADWYMKCVEAYVEAMRAADPSIEIIIDGDVQPIWPSIKQRLGDKVQHLAHHLYLPWVWSKVTKQGQPYPLEEMTAEEIWKAWVGIPDIHPVSGVSRDYSPVYDFARQNGYRVAITEWNWNGWSERDDIRPALNSSFAKGIGAAGFLHAFMREGDVVSLGCQSMLVGIAWGITAIRADETGQRQAYFLPAGQVTMFYGKHHGRNLLELAGEGVPRFSQPYGMGDISPKETEVACIDALATADEDKIYFHAINRDFDKDIEITIDLSAFSGLGESAAHHRFEGRLHNRPLEGEPREIGFFSTEQVKLQGAVLRVTLPKRSISIIEIPRAR
jgi:alpha-N-arabinofuranosidase